MNRSFTMMDERFLEDPYTQCPALQERSVFYAPDLDAYVVTRYRDVDAILPDTVHYSSSNTVSPITPPSEEAMAILQDAGYVPLVANLINADPPRHTQVRSYVSEAIHPRRLRALEPVVREEAAELIDAMIAKRRADLFTDLAFPLPAVIGFSLLGFPREDVEQLKEWCDRRVEFSYGRAPVEEQVRVAESIAAFWKYINAFVRERMAEPVDDFTSDLVRHHFEEPESFSPRDIATVLFGISLAAHDTTTNLILNGVRRLLERREQWEALLDDPSRIKNAVEECLRYDGPVIAVRRKATTAMEIDGTAIPADATVLLLFFSANRDPDQFDAPDAFDVTRPAARKHVTFGKGAHFCSGAPLARIEMQVVLEVLTAKAPAMSIAPDQTYEFVPNITLRGPKRLVVDMSPGPTRSDARRSTTACSGAPRV